MADRIKFLSLIGPDTKTSYGIMSQIYKNCNMDEHRFVILAYENCMERFPKLYEFDNLTFMPSDKSRLQKIKFLYDLMKRSDHIIFHSLFFTTYKYNLFFWFFRKFLKKAVWIEWGADLYLWQLPETSLKNKIKNHIAKVIRKNFSAVGVTFPVNEEVFREQFGNKARVFYTPMPNPINSATGLMEKIDSLNPEVIAEKAERARLKKERAEERRRRKMKLLEAKRNADNMAASAETIVEAPTEVEPAPACDETIMPDYEQLWKNFISFAAVKYQKQSMTDESDPIAITLSEYIDSLKPKAEEPVDVLTASTEETDTPEDSSIDNTTDIDIAQTEETSAEPPKIYHVQVAHNSFSFNHHVKLLNYLKQYKSEHMRLIMPMTYGAAGINGSFGGKEYLNAISKYGATLFGKKLNIMTDNIPFEEYVKFLWTIDIAVFDFDRPCGLGNIRILLYMGKKIFLPAGTGFYNFLVSKGIKVYDTNSIPDMTFEEFVAPPENNDLTWIKDYLNNDCAIEHWQEMFEELEKNAN